MPVPKCFQERGETFERNSDITRDGKQFPGVVAAGSAVASGAAAAPQTQVVLNSFEELKARVPTTYPSVRSGLGHVARINDDVVSTAAIAIRQPTKRFLT